MKTKLYASVFCVFLLSSLLMALLTSPVPASAENSDDHASSFGGGYAATGQNGNMGYMPKMYDISNGLETSDANFILCASSGYVWIGGYNGVLRYDGSVFTKLDTADGLTSSRALFEDSRHRIWVGTNDNGVVVLDGTERTHFTQQDGLTSSSIRSFAEDADGNVFIGTTAGVCYVDPGMSLHPLNDDRLNSERVLRLDADARGRKSLQKQYDDALSQVEAEISAREKELSDALEALSKEQSRELAGQGADAMALEKCDKEIAGLEERLEKISKNKEVIFNYRKDKEEYLDKKELFVSEKTKVEGKKASLSERYKLKRRKEEDALGRATESLQEM
jgi:hypothetical protein